MPNLLNNDNNSNRTYLVLDSEADQMMKPKKTTNPRQITETFIGNEFRT